VRSVLKLLLMWSLSPVGTILNTGLLAVVLLIGGADPHRPVFWLPLALFLGVSGFLDARAYLVQRRKGLTSYAVAEAVFERVWPSREGDGPR
jgi:UDP-N-acetylmuramyl pentapeptide phosphotransferase/UDP-N-acetylglucosamine-1-phosphate transferase